MSTKRQKIAKLKQLQTRVNANHKKVQETRTQIKDDELSIKTLVQNTDDATYEIFELFEDIRAKCKFRETATAVQDITYDDCTNTKYKPYKYIDSKGCKMHKCPLL